MPDIQYEALTISATSSGAITSYSARTYRGFVEAVGYNPTTSSTGLTPTTGGAIIVKTELTSQTVFTLNDIGDTGAWQRMWYPRVATVAATCSATASTGVGRIPLYNERLAVTVTSGSTDTVTKTGTLRFYVG
jgi:hypothetical protein